ncbi:hypothetical protein [Hufsiella ginkgonis]|uniref:Uncharacterized protein n=1 Tax=Hufsiella ginkgonis TaxID=2695274 RepID=A0A7K1XW06_9SPHI|nr:hypothetical protein [Hufsiella ginkgonis]MXV14998.1 hypothetical protein [Hufsiella ginkgonis]
MNWELADKLLKHMTATYTADNLRKVTFNKAIFPLLLRYENGERSPDLYNFIVHTEQALMRDIYH